MLEKGKITPYQLFSIIVLFVFGSTTILRALNIAGRDTWISTVAALIVSLCIALIYISLSARFPDKTLLEYAQLLLGKKIGMIIGVLYLWYFLHLGALVLRNFGELLATAVMPQTPMWFFHLTLALVTAFLIYNQLEVMARTSEIILPLTVSLSFATSLLITMTGHTDWNLLLPVFEKGLEPILLGTIPILTFPYGELVIFTMIFPALNKPSKLKVSVFAGITFGWLILFLILLQSLALFGEYMTSLTFPRFFAVRMIAVGDFIERIEPFVLVIWIMAGLIKVGVCLYGFSLGLAQLSGLKRYNILVLPSAILMATLAEILYGNVFEMLAFAVNIYPFYALPFQIGFPLLMFAVSLFKKKKVKPSGQALRQTPSQKRVLN